MLKKLKSLFIFCSCIVFYKAVAQDSIPLTLEQAVNLALTQNIDILVANKQVNIGEYALKETNGNRLPKLAVNARYNRNIDKQVIFLPGAFGAGAQATELGSDNDYTATLNLSLPLISSNNVALRQLAKTQLNYQTEYARGTKQTIATAVKKAYFNYLLALEIIKVQQTQLAHSQEILTDIKKRLKLGTVTQFDLASAKVQVANAKNNLLQAQSSSLPIENQFKLLLGIPKEQPVKLTDAISIINYTLDKDYTIQKMIDNNSVLKQLEIDIQRNNQTIKLEKSAFYPTLNAIGNYNYVTQADNFDFSDYNWVNTSIIGLQLQFSIFNGNITKNRVHQAKIAKQIAQDEEAYTRNAYIMQYEELISRLQFAQEKVAVQKDNMQVTDEALQLSRKRYKHGVGTFLEVTDAELSYTQARLNWLQAISEYKSAYFDFQLLIGNN